jgi:DMSO/TMAO reductase YedYZ molybdopterin-dependent catalytic subunit
VHRRGFLRGAALLGAAGALRCESRKAPTPSGSLGDAGACPPAGAPEESVPFADESGPFEVAEGAGLDGRLYTDLARLAPDRLITDSEAFYIRTRYPDQLDPAAPWTLSLGGMVEAPATLDAREVAALEREQGVHLLECSGNFRERGFGLISAATWHGVPVAELLARVAPAAGAARLLITGSDAHGRASSNSVRGASWILSPEQLAQTQSFIATRMNGQPLLPDHGYPLRLVNPGWYGCSCIKWVESIDWVSDDVASTSQMIEFSARTHQTGEPALARDYAAPVIQQAAMPIRVDKRRAGGRVCYRVLGIVWGGSEPARRLGVSVDGGERFEPIPLDVSQNRTWSLWEHEWAPLAPGRYDIVCRVEEPRVPMRRLDSGYYRRSVVVDEV